MHNNVIVIAIHKKGQIYKIPMSYLPRSIEESHDRSIKYLSYLPRSIEESHDRSIKYLCLTYPDQ